MAATLGTFPAGSYTWSPPASVPRRPTSLTFIERGSATNCILGYFAGPSVKSPDYPAFEVATEVLSGMLNATIRGKVSLSYAAFAPYEGRGIATGGLYVSTKEPTLVLLLMREQLLRVRVARFPAWSLHDFEKEFSAAFIMETETSAGQAAALARAQLYDGDYHKTSDELDRLRHVSPPDVARAARTYMRDIQFVYVGDTTRVQRLWVRGM